MRKAMILTVLLLAAISTASFAAEKGSSMFSINVSQGQFDGYFLNSPYIGSTSFPEQGVSAEYWYMLSEDYALAIQGTYGFSSESQKPGAGGSGEVKFKTTSFKGRVGGDRVGQIGDRFTWFMGPGVEFWTGKEKIEPPTGPQPESENIKRFGLSGRVGGVMKLSQSVGIQGQIGNTLGIATATAKNEPTSFFGDAASDGAKLTTWTSSFNASWGIVFSFGSAK